MKVTSPNTPLVLYVITKATGGGAQKYVYTLIEAARAAGYQAALAYGVSGVLSEQVKALGLATYQIPGLARDISITDEFRACAELVRLFRKQRPSVVHLNSSKVGGLGSVAAHIAGVPHIIFTAHGWAFTESRSFFSKLFFFISHYITGLLCNRIIAVSKKSASYPKKWPLVSHKVVTIHNGVDNISFLSKEEARSILAERDSSLLEMKNALWIGTVAELHANKGLDHGITAWQSSKKDAQWILIGDGEKEIHLQKQRNNDASIHLLGFVRDARKYMSAFDIFFLPSRTEALAYVLLEAGMARLPVVATNVGGIPEIIENGKTGLLVPSGDFKSMNIALSRLIEDEGLRKELGDNLREQVLADFSEERMLDETFELYSH